MPRGEATAAATVTGRRWRQLITTVLILSATAAALGGCATGGGRPVTASGGLLDQLGMRGQAVSRERPYETTRGAIEYADGVILGTVTHVSEGVGLLWQLSQTGDELGSSTLAYGDPAAQVHTLHLSVRVEEGLTGDADFVVGDEVAVGLVVDTPLDPKVVQAEMDDLGRVVIFLSSSPVFAYADHVWGVLEDGAFVGTVTPEEIVLFPVLDIGSGLLSEDPLTLDDLRTP